MTPRTMRLLVLICCISFLVLMRPSTVQAENLLRPAATAPDLSAIAAGAHHTSALTTDGGVKCWGANRSGQLGNGTITGAGRGTPADVAGLSSGVDAIAAGGSHTCALTTGGGLKCWGDNEYGQLGDGTTVNRTTSVDVVGLPSGVSAVAVGGTHTSALTTDGGIKCWGWGPRGELGAGPSVGGSLTPVDVVGLSSGVSAIAAGWSYTSGMGADGSHTCALTTGGAVKCWGRNTSGELGDGTTEDRSTPVDVAGLAGGISAITVDGSHSCALTTDGDVKCWGANSFGQLGDDTMTASYTPVDVMDLPADIAAIAAGNGRTCALTVAGGVKCWGNNWWHGGLGDGTLTNRTTPVDVAGLSSGVSAIAVGGGHNCALITSGSVKCWGDNEYGQLGNHNKSEHHTPAAAVALPSAVSVIDAGMSHTCALTAGGGVKCWGKNEHGQLGDGMRDSRYAPMDVAGLSRGVGAIAVGKWHTCASTTDGNVKCWGQNEEGQLGDGTITDTGRSTPVDVAGLPSDVSAIAAGVSHTCALTTGGGVKCWGDNSTGQLGDGTMIDRVTPVDVAGLSSGVSAIGVGWNHTCALTIGGGVKCWGYNWSGQLGDGTTTSRTTPVDVVNLTSGVSAIAVGWNHTCAVLTEGRLKCWGSNWHGQLGDDTKDDRNTPVDVVGLSSDVSAVAAGSIHTCALTTSGGVKCWGENWSGVLGNGTGVPSTTPVDVVGLSSGVGAIATGTWHSCALTTSGLVRCWGANSGGQLGTNPGWVPADVIWLEDMTFFPLISR